MAKDKPCDRSSTQRQQCHEIPEIRFALLAEDLEGRPAAEILDLLEKAHSRLLAAEAENEALRSRQRESTARRSHCYGPDQQAPVGSLCISEKGEIIEANRLAAEVLGEDRHALTTQPISRYILAEDTSAYRHHHDQLLKTGEQRGCTLRMVKKDNTIFWGHLKAVLKHTGEGIRVFRTSLENISEYKFRENEGELAARLIAQINSPADFRQCMINLAASLQGWSGCEAIGIRLQDGEDYPYYQTRGFSSAFVQSENRLCAYGADGELLVDASGTPILDCMCGNILRSRFDPTLPFFTVNGSFWTNSTTALLRDAGKAARLARTRNNCNRAGYESVALVPLRTDHQVFGLLQFNDSRTHRFSPALIAHFERIASILTTALWRRQTEKLLRESEEKYRTVLEFTYAMETWRTPDGRYRYVSPSCLRVTGYSEVQFLADPDLIISITHPDDQAAVRNHFLLANQDAGKHNQGMDFRILTPGGELRWISHSCTSVYGAGGQWLGRRESFREITKRKQAEAEKEILEIQNRQLLKMESLGRMAGAIAHHFNNKLHAVMGHLELAMENLPRESSALYSLASAISEAGLAADISKSMLTYLGRISGEKRPQDLSETCRRCLSLLKSTVANNILMNISLDAPNQTISTNDHHIHQILTRLINNGCEAIGAVQGTLRLSVESVPAAAISPINRFPGDWQAEESTYVCLTVEDSGCGMRSREIEEAFDPFYSTKFTGRGLGLSETLGIVQAHKGAVTVESAPGRGSVFRIFFPPAEEVVFHQPSMTEDASQIRGGGSVLVVDDDPIVLKLTGQMLMHLGYTVLSAQDGYEALEIFHRHKGEVRFVLSDYSMPRMNGLETLHTLRRIDPAIPVILASGYTWEQVMNDNQAKHPLAFLEKPFNLETLKKAIQQTLADSQIVQKRADATR